MLKVIFPSTHTCTGAASIGLWETNLPLLHQPKKQLALATDSNLHSATRSMLDLFPKCSGLPHVPLLKRPSTLMLPLPPSENKSLREERVGGRREEKKR